MEELLYTRADAGGFPVRVKEQGGHTTYTLEMPDKTFTFSSARQLLIKVTGHPKARNWSFNRYFRKGTYARPVDFSLLEFFQPAPLITLNGTVYTEETSRRRPNKVSQGKIYPLQTTIGIDLKARGKEVAKLLFAGFGGKIRAGGYDPEDVLQEVYKGILVRNAGTCPFDPGKSSFGHYVHMVCSCILSNYHRRHQRRAREQVGIYGYNTDEGCALVDVGDEKAKTPITATDVSDTIFIQDIVSSLKNHPQRSLALRILPYIQNGFNRTEIVEILGETRANVYKACSLLRTHITEFLKN